MSANLRHRLTTNTYGDYVLAGVCSAIVFCIAHYAVFGNPLLLNDDVRQQIYWMESWRTPGLFAHSWLTDYARHYVSFGVRGTYWLASHFLSPLRFSQFLPGILFTLLGVCIYGCGAALMGRTTAWCGCAVFWLMPGFLYNMSGGLARAFAAPLLALFLWGWIRHSTWMTVAALLLSALFIPYIAVLCGATLGFAWLLWRLHLAPAPPLLARIWHWLVLLTAAAITYAFSLEMTRAGFGPLVTAAEMAGKPEFGELGRFPILPVPSLLYELLYRPFERLLPFRELGIAVGIVAALGLAYACYLGGKRVPWKQLSPKLQGILQLGCASLLLYFAARVVLLQLFIPTRYLEYTTILIYTLLIGLCISPLFFKLGHRKKVLLLACCILLAGMRLHNEALQDYAGDKALFEAVWTSPKDALFAGHPHTMDNVLSFGQRNVLSSYELAHPWSRGLWTRLEPRIDDFFTAYYSQDLEVVRQFVKKYQIDYLIVDTRQFDPDYLQPSRELLPFYEATHFPGWLQSLCRTLGLEMKILTRIRPKNGKPGDHPFFEPFASRIKAIISQGKEFALLKPTGWPCLKIGPYYRMLDVRSLKK